MSLIVTGVALWVAGIALINVGRMSRNLTKSEMYSRAALLILQGRTGEAAALKAAADRMAYYRPVSFWFPFRRYAGQKYYPEV